MDQVILEVPESKPVRRYVFDDSDGFQGCGQVADLCTLSFDRWLERHAAGSNRCSRRFRYYVLCFLGPLRYFGVLVADLGVETQTARDEGVRDGKAVHNEHMLSMRLGRDSSAMRSD